MRSGDVSVIWYFTSTMDYAGGIAIWFKRFTSTVHYTLLSCNTWSPFPKKPPVRKNKVWIIEKRGFRTIIKCNEEKLLDITASSKTCNSTKYRWETVLTDEVKFVTFPRKYDTASEVFYAGKYYCLYFVRRCHWLAGGGQGSGGEAKCLQAKGVKAKPAIISSIINNAIFDQLYIIDPTIIH